MGYEAVFKVIEIILQIILIFFAWKALSVWKKEIKGKDKYKQSKELLEYIKNLRFLIYSKEGSFHQIYLNDILTNPKNFYKTQLFLIGKEKVYFNNSIFGLFNHLNIRSNLFLSKRIQNILYELYPISAKKISDIKSNQTYVEISGIELPNEISNQDDSENIYIMNGVENITIEQYFKIWEKLIKELQKNI